MAISPQGGTLNDCNSCRTSRLMLLNFGINCSTFHNNWSSIPGTSTVRYQLQLLSAALSSTSDWGDISVLCKALPKRLYLGIWSAARDQKIRMPNRVPCADLEDLINYVCRHRILTHRQSPFNTISKYAESWEPAQVSHFKAVLCCLSHLSLSGKRASLGRRSRGKAFLFLKASATPAWRI